MKVQLSDRRLLALHREVVKCLDQDPSLWEVGLKNLDRWEASGSTCWGYEKWREILVEWPQTKILKIMLSKSQLAVLLRSTSPFAGIISEDTRAMVFKRYSSTAGRKTFAYL